MNGDYTYIRIVEADLDLGRKTKLYRIHNKRSGEVLGSIGWYPTWRQNCFSPHGNTVWSAGCLADVQDFLKQLAELRRAKRGS